MKKITITFAAATVAILLLVTGCDKYHRDKYTGTWDFVTERKFYNYNDTVGFVYEKSEMLYYSGKISLGNDESELFIRYTENDEISGWLRQDGNSIYTLSQTSFYGKDPSGYFDGKNNVYIRFNQNVMDNSEMNIIGGIDDHITGTKKGRR